MRFKLRWIKLDERMKREEKDLWMKGGGSGRRG
jgi:hypothetical protein